MQGTAHERKPADATCKMVGRREIPFGVSSSCSGLTRNESHFQSNHSDNCSVCIPELKHTSRRGTIHKGQHRALAFMRSDPNSTTGTARSNAFLRHIWIPRRMRQPSATGVRGQPVRLQAEPRCRHTRR